MLLQSPQGSEGMPGERMPSCSANEAFYSKLAHAESYAVGEEQMDPKTGALAPIHGRGSWLLWMDIFVKPCGAEAMV